MGRLVWFAADPGLRKKQKQARLERVVAKKNCVNSVQKISVSHGFGFPFDRPHFDFYRRMEEAYPALVALKQKMSDFAPLLPLVTINRTLADKALAGTVLKMQKKIDIDQVREALAETKKETQRYPKRMAKVFKIPHLPKRLTNMTSKKMAHC